MPYRDIDSGPKTPKVPSGYRSVAGPGGGKGTASKGPMGYRSTNDPGVPEPKFKSSTKGCPVGYRSTNDPGVGKGNAPQGQLGYRSTKGDGAIGAQQPDVSRNPTLPAIQEGYFSVKVGTTYNVGGDPKKNASISYLKKGTDSQAQARYREQGPPTIRDQDRNVGQQTGQKPTNAKRSGATRQNCCVRRRKLWIALFVALVVILVPIAIYVVVYKFQWRTFEGQVKWYADSCMSHHKTKKECMAATVPTEKFCQSGGTCFRYKYKVEVKWDGTNPVKATWTESDRIKFKPNPTDSHLCRISKKGKLGVCSYGRCNFLYNGKDDKKWQQASEWQQSSECFNSLQSPNPCWENAKEEWTNLMGSHMTGVVNRERCLQAKNGRPDCNNDCCKPGAHAIVWMQHLKCNTSNERFTAQPCQGFPLRLWKCGECPSSDKKPNADEAPPECDQETSTGHLQPAGAKCHLKGEDGATMMNDDEQPVEAYCFLGKCFEAAGPGGIEDTLKC